MNKIDIIAGARPNFMKIGPIIHAIHRHNMHTESPIEYRLIHTGQHYDKKMSEDFFQQLDIPEPHINLGVGSGSQAEQTAKIMMRYEKAIGDWKPELTIVVGDVTSTMACTIVAKKAWIKVAHVEGGIRSGDLKMPEEINRMVTDSISDYFFTTSKQANLNLKKEGIKEDQIFFVGNTMIDSLLSNLSRIKQPNLWSENSLEENEYFVATLHRPSNVDSQENLDILLTILNENCAPNKIVFPIHPRTLKNYKKLNKNYSNFILTGPMSYLEFIYLIKNSAGVITDSGGITEETTVLDIPCITLRNSTERPETITMGTNELVGTNPKDIIPYLRKMVKGEWKSGKTPPLWDGHTSDRIVEVITKL